MKDTVPYYYTRQDPSKKCKARWWQNDKCSPEEKIFVVVNGVESPPFTSASEPAFSPDSRRFTYRAKKGREDDWQNWTFKASKHSSGSPG